MAADSDVVRISFKELEEISLLNEKKEEEELKRREKEEAKKKLEEEEKKLREEKKKLEEEKKKLEEEKKKKLEEEKKKLEEDKKKKLEEEKKKLEEEKKKKLEEEKKKKRDEDKKKKRPTVGVYRPPSLLRNKKELQDKDEGKITETETPFTDDRVASSRPHHQPELHVSEENWEEETSTSSISSSKENSVDRELEGVNLGLQDLKVTSNQSAKSRKSEENRRRSKRPEIKRYIPKGRVLEQQNAELSGEGSVDWTDELSSPSHSTVHSPSPGPSPLATTSALSQPHSPSPRKIDLKNMQVTVVNDNTEHTASVEDAISPSKHVDINTENSPHKHTEQTGQTRNIGRGQGQSYSRGRGQRLNTQRSGRGGHGQIRQDVVNTNKSDLRGGKHRGDNYTGQEQDLKQDKQLNKGSRDTKHSQDLYIVPSRPNTIGQEADRTATIGYVIGSDQTQKQTDETSSLDKQALLMRFKSSPSKSKSRSYDKLNNTENWDEEGYYPDPKNLGTMVFERSRSSEQLNLSGRNAQKPPMPRSSSGGTKNTMGKKHGFQGGFRKRTDSFSSDISTGTGSDWSTEDLDWDKEEDNNKLDWNAEVERELALQVQDETQKMNAWFEKQELGLSQPEMTLSQPDLGLSLSQSDVPNTLNNARDNIMTSSTGSYNNYLTNRPDLSQEKSNTLPFAHRRKRAEEQRGRRQDRHKGGLQGFRSRDSSVSSVQSVNSVQSAYSNEGRRRRRRRRKSSGGSGSQTSRSGSLEGRGINIQVTCGGRREVKVDNKYGGNQNPKSFSRQISNESQNSRKGKGDQWNERRDSEPNINRERRGPETGQIRGNRGKGYENKEKDNERTNEPYYPHNPRDRWNREEAERQNRQPGRYDGRGRQRHDSGGNRYDDHHRNYRDNNRQTGATRDKNDRNENEERRENRPSDNTRNDNRQNNQSGGTRDRFDKNERYDRNDFDRRQNKQNESQRNRKDNYHDRDSQRKPSDDSNRRGNRDNYKYEDRDSQGRRSNDRDVGRVIDNVEKDPPHQGGILHLPPQSKTPDPEPSHNNNNPAYRSNPGDNTWGRGQAPQGRGRGRERNNSGGNRQKTLFDPNNPTKPIVIEEAKPKLDFKDTDSYPSSPQSPQYLGASPQEMQMYNRGYGGGGPPYYPPHPGYGGYGYNMPGPHPMMPPGMRMPPPRGMMPLPRGPEGMFYGGYPQQYRDSTLYQDDTYARDPYYHTGLDQEQQVIGGRSRSQCRMMAEHLLREALPMDKQLNSLISRRIGGEDTLHLINQLRRELQVRFEQLILLDPDLANKQNVEQLLWKSVFYQMVELTRRQMAEDQDGDVKLRLHKILEEGTTFYENLLAKLQSTFNFSLDTFLDSNILPPENLSRTIKLALLSVQRTMICLGDVARYKEQNNDGGKVNYAKARSWYSKAQQIAPKNGRPYNQLAILAVYTVSDRELIVKELSVKLLYKLQQPLQTILQKHRLDAVYFYMRSLAASNPFLTARESLMSLFDDARKKAEVVEKRRMEEKKKQEGLRKNHTVNQHRVEIWVKNNGTSSTSNVDDNYDEDLSKLEAVELNRRFVLSFLNVHGKLFTKIGMEMFDDSCGLMLHEFKVLLKDSAITPSRMLQLMAINMFAIENTALKDESLESTCRSLLQQHSVQMGLDMFGILVDRCSILLAAHIKTSDYPDRMFSRELEELIPSVKVWTDWMICHADLWNPPPGVRDPGLGPPIDVWTSTSTLCNILKDMDTSYVKFTTDRNDDMEPVILSEDTSMSGFVPLLSTPLNNTFVDSSIEKDVARDCLRIEKLRVFGEYLCGIEPPMLAYSVENRQYYSVAPPEGYENDDPNQDIHQMSEDDDIVIESEEIIHGDDHAPHGHDDHVHQLRAKKEELTKQITEQKKHQENREKVLEKNRHRSIEIEIRPIFLIPDTNCFIDHLPSLQKLIDERQYTIVIPLVVINELDGLAQGSRAGQFTNEGHAQKVKTRARATIEYLEVEFDKKNSHLKALTSKGSVMDTISYRSEDTDMTGNNDDLILSCCTYYCKDKARDFMPKDKDTAVRLYREVVLLTEDRNLRLKAHTHNVPVKEIPAFMKWSTGT